MADRLVVLAFGRAAGVAAAHGFRSFTMVVLGEVCAKQGVMPVQCSRHPGGVVARG